MREQLLPAFSMLITIDLNDDGHDNDRLFGNFKMILKQLNKTTEKYINDFYTLAVESENRKTTNM